MLKEFRPSSETWKPMYRTGGISAFLFVVSGVAALALYMVNPPPVTGGEATLRFIADHKASYIAQQVLWLIPSLFGLIVFTAILLALISTSPNLTVLGYVVGAASWTALLAVPVTSEGTLSLVYLSDQYAGASAAGRSSFVAAAEAFVAENNTVSIAGALTPLGVLLISLPMLRGRLPQWVGWLGVITGALGLVSEALRFAAPALYAAYGPLLWIWFAVVGVSLLRLSPSSASTPRQGDSLSQRGSSTSA